jgi:L-asparagine transporter-like permease
MIFVAYAFLIVALVAYARRSIRPVPPQFELLTRAFGGIVGLAFVFAALLLLGGDPSGTGVAVLLMLAIGTGVYVWGLVRWRGAAGLTLRRTGWFLLAVATPSPRR